MASRFRWTLTKQATDLYPETSEVLTNDPIGWDDMTLRLTRDKFYHGVFTEFSLSLKFHCRGGGKSFIDNVYATEDINGIITVLIEIDCDGTGTYTELYTGRLNLASYSTDDEYTSCNIERSDLYSKLKARDEVSVDLESTTSIGEETITAPNSADLAMHSQLLFLKSSFEGRVPLTFDTDVTVQDSFTIRGFMSHQFSTTSTEAENFLGAVDFSDIAVLGPDASGTFIPEIFEATDDDVEYPDTYTYRLHFSGIFSDILASAQTRINVTHSLVLRYGADHATSTAITLWTNGGGETYSTPTHTHSFDTGLLSGQITLSFMDKVWIEWFVSEVISTGPFVSTQTFRVEYDVADFSIEINSSVSPTVCKSFLIHEAFNQVADSIADTDYSFISDFYGRTDSQKISYNSDGCGSMIAITNGLNIRAFSEKKIYCSLKDLFTSFHALHNIGLTIEPFDSAYAPLQDIIRVEKLSYFYDSTTLVLNLIGGVKVETTNDNTRSINNINIGYDRWETEYIGGLDEPNTKHEYSTRINSVNGKFDKFSKYIASGYAIESTRRKSIEESRDWRYDNDNFAIAATQQPYVYNVTGQWLATSIVVIQGTNYDIQIGDVIDVTGTVSNNSTFTVIAIGDGFFNTTLLGFAEATVAEATVSFTITKNVALSAIKWRAEKYADSFTNGSGMVSLDTAYNLRLTPARMLLAHMNAITACLQVIRGIISFVKGEGNTALAAQKNDVGCQEDYNESIPYGDVILNENQSFDWNDPNVKNITPLWIPEIYKFEYPLTASQLATLRANPHGYIQVTDDHNNIKKGFILDAEFILKTGKTRFELLRMYE